MTARINITLNDEEYEKLMKCYKHFISTREWRQPPPSLTGYAASIVIGAADRIIVEKKL